MDQDSNSDWDSLPPNQEDFKHDVIQMENGEDDPPFDFRSEVEPKTSNPKSKAPSINKSKLNTYGVTNIELENKKLTSVKSITDKSYETNDTPKSQVTIVPRKMSKTDRMISRPPLQRKANEDNDSNFGMDNPGFDDSYSIREKPSKNGSPKAQLHQENVIYPKSEERILLWQFEEPAESYLQITEDKSGLKSETVAINMVDKCDLILSEVFGFIKIPFMLLILFIGHLFLFILKSLFKPISDYLLKPFLVSLHNWLCVPLCGLSHHGCILCTHTISPCFRMVAVTCCSSRKLDMSSPLPY